MSKRVVNVPLIAGAVALGACTNDRTLPEDFVLGAAVAGFQVDMGCPAIPAEECEDRNSDWYAFITSTTAIAKPSNFLKGDPPSKGPGHYELWEGDFDRLKDLSLDGFRFSIEWSRVFPESTIGIEGHQALKARASAKALDHYRAQLAGLRARGVRPLVTLHHYTLPSWIHDARGCNRNLDTCSPRGWLEPGIVAEIAKYSGFVAKELGAEVDLWATLNEPFAVVLPGFLFQTKDRTNPPAQSLRFAEAKTAAIRMIEAHARMVDAVRAADTADADGDGQAVKIGLVYPVAPVIPRDPESSTDRLAAKNIFYLYNELFLNAVLRGVLDDDLDGTGEPRADLAGRSDYLGLNYYARVVVEGESESVAPDFSPLLTLNPLTLSFGDVYPRGLYETITFVQKTYGVPIYVTENGTYPEIEGGQEKFLAEHFQWMLRAIRRDQADVRGYFWWSLVDNYEWNQGMALRFGLYEVDPDDAAKARVRRPFADVYRRIAEARELPSEVAESYPLPAD